MKIVISNDDGIYSPGIIALANVASSFGDVLIVAPDVEQIYWLDPRYSCFASPGVPGEH